MDISEQKAAQLALEKSERLYRLLTENANDVIWSCDLDMAFQYVSPSVEKLLGWTPDEVIEGGVTMTLPPESLRLAAHNLRVVLDQNQSGRRVSEPAIFEIEQNRKDGTRVWTEVSARPFFDDEGRMTGASGVTRDISERKKAEKALLRAKQEWERTFDSLPDLIAILDDRHRILRANRAMAERLGLTPGQCIGRTCYESIHGTNQPIASCPHALNLVDGQEHTMEVHETRLGGDFLVSCTPLFDEGGARIGSVHVARDITERKRATEASRRDHERLQRFVDANILGVIIASPSGPVIEANDYYLRTIGYTREEFEQGVVDWRAITPPEWLPSDEHAIKELRERGTSTPYEKEYVRRDGTRVSVILFDAMLPGPEEQIAAFVLDTTDSKLMEEELKQSEKRFRMVVESAPDAIFVRTVSGQYVYLNQAAVGLFGATSTDQMIGRHIREHIPPDEYATLAERIQRLNDGQAVPMIEQTFLRMDGSPVTVEVSAVPLEYGGTNGALIFARDISERKRAEKESRVLQERLQRAEKMESLGMLAGGVAHDLNNAMGILVGYSELLLDDIDKSSPLKTHVEYIKQGGERAAAIVQDLLTMARRGVQTSEIVDLNSIIDEFQDSPEFEKICSFHPNVRVETMYSAGLLNIKGSPIHLRKTVMNLFSNAAEAMPEGGLITISTSNEYLDRPVAGYDDVQEGDYVVLSVTDKGEGISASEVKRIFEPFYTKKILGRSGTGLGLAVVWGTVKDHDGYINVQSEEGKGTTFSLYFPVTREEATKERQTIPVADYMGKGESILVVDDVQGQRDLAARMLAKLNYQVTTVPGGEEAVEYLKTYKVDLVVLDMIMDAGMDGLATYRAILEIHPKQKAIIVSGFSESDRVRKAQVLGAGAYVRKPYMQEVLGLAVKKEIDKKELP